MVDTAEEKTLVTNQAHADLRPSRIIVISKKVGMSVRSLLLSQFSRCLRLNQWQADSPSKPYSALIEKEKKCIRK